MPRYPSIQKSLTCSSVSALRTHRRLVPICGLHFLSSRNLPCFVWPFFVYERLRAQTPSGGSGPLRRACAPFAAKAAQGCRRQTPAAARGYALLWAVVPTALTCAGGHPPQRPPPKTRLTDDAPSSQQ